MYHSDRALYLILESSLTDGLVGDYNFDGTVGADDLNLVLFHWNVNEADLTPDWINQRPETGVVVGADQLNGVLFNWVNATSVASVPEPSSMLIALGVALAAIRCRKRHDD